MKKNEHSRIECTRIARVGIAHTERSQTERNISTHGKTLIV